MGLATLKPSARKSWLGYVGLLNCQTASRLTIRSDEFSRRSNQISFQKAFLQWIENARFRKSNRGSTTDSHRWKDGSWILHRSGQIQPVTSGQCLGDPNRESRWAKSRQTKSQTRLPRFPSFWKCWNFVEPSSPSMRWGARKKIAKDIVNGGGDYILAVKGNQPTLQRAVEEHFTQTG